MKIVCPVDGTIDGIDVSHWQGNVNWDTEKNRGVEFAFIKASEGKSFHDPWFTRHWANVKAAGIFRGAYHFFHPNLDPKAQAQSFLRVVGHLQPDDLPCVMDWESTGGLPNAEDVKSALTFLKIVEAATKKVPIIYGSPYFLNSLVAKQEIAHYPLWIAHYGAKCPLVPEPFKNWKFWQYSDKGGDKNLFNGSIKMLRDFATAKI